MQQIDWRFVCAGLAIIALGVIVAAWLLYYFRVGSKRIAEKV
jgi:hypothetical protein